MGTVAIGIFSLDMIFERASAAFSGFAQGERASLEGRRVGEGTCRAS